jgi:hypothetical protein
MQAEPSARPLPDWCERCGAATRLFRVSLDEAVLLCSVQEVRLCCFVFMVIPLPLPLSTFCAATHSVAMKPHHDSSRPTFSARIFPCVVHSVCGHSTLRMTSRASAYLLLTHVSWLPALRCSRWSRLGLDFLGRLGRRRLCHRSSRPCHLLPPVEHTPLARTRRDPTSCSASATCFSSRRPHARPTWGPCQAYHLRRARCGYPLSVAHSHRPLNQRQPEARFQQMRSGATWGLQGLSCHRRPVASIQPGALRHVVRRRPSTTRPGEFNLRVHAAPAVCVKIVHFFSNFFGGFKPFVP